ncbi:MAG: CBS domain-containing protein [Planctomycetota bacterium]|nr:MAG: CBS domain-containing protein [Planctomycetota bacterium]
MSESKSVKTGGGEVWPESQPSSFPVQLEVGNIMSEGVISISPAETVASAAKVMSENNTSCAVVLEDGELVGMVTERDCLKRVGGGDREFEKREVREVMSSPVESVSCSTTVFEASRVMGERGLRGWL